MQLKNRYYRYLCEISFLVDISKEELVKKLIELDIGHSFETKDHVIRLKQKTESHGQTLYYICVYDKIGRLVRNDPVFLTQPKREKYPSL